MEGLASQEFRDLVGRSLNHYEILGPLGAGGMGEVYRALDGNLHREVAVKLLPAEFSSDPERLARLRREARLLAALNHPNIAAIHSLEQDGETHFLVLELVEGETLAGQIARGPLPVGLALQIARQMIHALEAAHGRGIIHRDLKPANIKITPEGEVKVLDLGLAKSTESVPAEELSSAPTLDDTRTGVVMGTVPYMSPEQARGVALDHRTDIWSFGVILYEMLTATNPFQSATLSDTLAGLLKEDPDWGVLPSTTPEQVRRLLRRCLQKKRKARLRDIGDAGLEIDEAIEAPEQAVEYAEMGSPASRGPRWATAALLGAGFALAVGLATWYLAGGGRPLAAGVTRFSISIPEDLGVDRLAVSPTGEHIVISGQTEEGDQLYLRSMNALGARRIDGTKGATRPSFSRDGQWITFNVGNDLLKVGAQGGAPQILCSGCVNRSSDADWSPRGDRIIFELTGTLWEIPATGGDPVQRAEPNRDSGETHYERPTFLPDGRTVLVELLRQDRPAAIAAVSLDSGALQVLVDEGLAPRLAESGHILYKRGAAPDTEMVALAYDAHNHEVIGRPTPVLQGVSHFGVSSAGTLGFVPARTNERRLVWVDRQGRAAAVSEHLRPYHRVSLAPDGRRVAVTIEENDTSEIWVLDLRNDILQQLTFRGADSPVWGPGGDWLGFVSTRTGDFGLYRTDPDRVASEPELLLSSTQGLNLGDVFPDGSRLVYVEWSPSRYRDLRTLPLAEVETEPSDLLATPADEITPAVSPDGKWWAFMLSTRVGIHEIYLAETSSGTTRQISDGGGDSPVWSPDGRELFYVSRGGEYLMVVDITTEPELKTGEPRRLFPLGDRFNFSTRTTQRYDISADGQRFLMVEPLPPPREVNVVLNWFEELRERVPVDR